jgi:hypothetical protein
MRASTSLPSFRLSTTSSEMNLSLTLAPESKVTNGQGVAVTHKQNNAQLMYSHRF